MQALLTPTAASFEAPVELLMACHERVRHYAQLLPRLLEHVEAHGADEQARQAAANILRYFEVAAPLHHQDEDEDLFPLLSLRGGAELGQRIAAITAEHAELGALWAEVRQALQQLLGGDGLLLSRTVAETFARRYPAHAEIEDREIYPWAAQLLSAEELAELGRRMAERRRAV